MRKLQCILDVMQGAASLLQTQLVGLNRGLEGSCAAWAFIVGGAPAQRLCRVTPAGWQAVVNCLIWRQQHANGSAAAESGVWCRQHAALAGEEQPVAPQPLLRLVLHAYDAYGCEKGSLLWRCPVHLEGAWKMQLLHAARVAQHQGVMVHSGA